MDRFSVSTFNSGRDMPTHARLDYVVTKRSGRREPFDEGLIVSVLERACHGIGDVIDISLVLGELYRTIFDGIATVDVEKGLILAATTFIERDPAYSILASRLLRAKCIREVVGVSLDDHNQQEVLYRQLFAEGIRKGLSLELFDKRLAEFDVSFLAEQLRLERDDLIDYMGMYTLYERYFLKDQHGRYETPQAFWMRVAMGLAIDEPDKNERAVEFYTVMSTLRYLPGTPTLFHSAFKRAQLSSCYLNTVGDDLGDIFKCLGDNAQLAKWAGGLGTDWTNIRGTGSLIKSIKASSQGVIPYLKIANDVVVAITKSGIRRGGSCAYLEVWHIDVEDFLDLRRNTGDERRRTHDMNTAVWVPDLFMKRVINNGTWTLFSPHETPDLHHIYGKAFEEAYERYEQCIGTEKVTLYKQVPAQQLWRKMLTRLFETGHPWITFKDPCNIRSPQDHAGVVHCSNLCTEIVLNTSDQETAVCNLGSVNLKAHVTNNALDCELLENTVKTAVRMLDNVIDLNFYPTKEARFSNSKHRPLGLGIMGFQDALFQLDIPFSSPKALEFSDEAMELVSYHAIHASSLLAREKGTYTSYKGSKWDRGVFPLDTIELVEHERGMPIDVSRTSRLDWQKLKSFVAEHGMRNSNVMAIAPTATISTIAGCYPCIEPIFKNIYVKSNVSGEFTVTNGYLVKDLKNLKLWNQDMLDQIKYYDGDLEHIKGIPVAIKEKYKTAFELDAEWLIRITAARGKWIDQSQSHNVFLKGASGKKLESVYMTAWQCGMKTMYYLRTLGATQVEKSTLDAKTYGFTQKREYQALPNACALENTDCESCQ